MVNIESFHRKRKAPLYLILTVAIAHLGLGCGDTASYQSVPLTREDVLAEAFEIAKSFPMLVWVTNIEDEENVGSSSCNENKGAAGPQMSFELTYVTPGINWGLSRGQNNSRFVTDNNHGSIGPDQLVALAPYTGSGFSCSDLPPVESSEGFDVFGGDVARTFFSFGGLLSIESLERYEIDYDELFSVLDDGHADAQIFGMNDGDFDST